MFDALKELIGLVKELPEFALWILLGYLLYKLFVVGSIYGIIRLAISKAHDYLVKPKISIKTISMDGKFFYPETVQEDYQRLIQELISFRRDIKKSQGKKITSGWGDEIDLFGGEQKRLRFDDVQWARDVLRKEYEKEMKNAIPKK